jgi:hypothetical protein
VSKLTQALGLLSISVITCQVCGQTLVDPSRPFSSGKTVNTEVSNKRSLILQSIISSGDKRQAIISNNRVTVGQVLADYTVKAIDKTQVVLVNGSEQLVLSLYSPALVTE